MSSEGDLDLFKDVDFKKKIIYPACVMFCVIVFVYFLIAMAAGVNVQESETVYTQIYDGGEDTNELDASIVPPKALPVQTLLGILLFSLSVMVLGLLEKNGASRVFATLVHYLGSVVSFFIFVLVISGFASTVEGLAVSLIACLMFTVVYFAVRGIGVLIRKIKNERFGVASQWFSKVCFFFTVTVFALSFFALVSGFNVIVKFKEDQIFLTDDVVQNVFVTVMTPLAPTIQNYLRYLGSAAVFALSMLVLRTKLGNVTKALLNFVILVSGFVLIWIVGMDYFRLVSTNAMIAVMVFLSVYAVVLVTVCVIRYVKARRSEDGEEYETQFSSGKMIK